MFPYPVEEFQIISVIGSGAFGKVAKYWNSRDKQFYAIKIIIS